jgi:hypothetical protein
VTDDRIKHEILSAGPDDGDWTDVVRRATRGRRRSHIYAAVAVTALVVVGVATAYAMGHPIVDFGTADQAPYKAVAELGGSEESGVLADQAREIPGLSVDGKPYELSVAPTKEGGFCIRFVEGGVRTIPCLANIADRRTIEKMIYLSMSADGLAGQLWIGGAFLEKEGERLEVTYADGANDEIPFVWVNAPINAGIFVLSVSGERRVHARGPVFVTLFDRNGNVIAREPITDPTGFTSADHHDLPGYPHLSVPPEAIWEKRRQLFDLRADGGARVGLWVAPGRDGSTCVWTTRSYRCFDSSQAEKGLGLVLSNGGGKMDNGNPVILGGDRVGEGIVKVEARFEDGDKVELTPKEGFLIWPIPSRHYPSGHRLEELVGYEADGQVVARQSVNTTLEPNFYPVG